jgi:F0F1-type ATP synthase alpha subunit
VTSKYVWCGVLIVALSVALSSSAEAQTGGKKIVSNGTIAGVLIGAAAVVGIVAYVVIHESTKKRSITGCVIPAGGGMSLTDEKDKRSYALSGNTADVKAGDRVTLQGKRIKAKDGGKAIGKVVAWETKTISKDFGACQPAT